MEIRNNSEFKIEELGRYLQPKALKRMLICMIVMCYSFFVFGLIEFLINEDSIFEVWNLIIFGVCGTIFVLLSILNPILIKKNNKNLGDTIRYEYVFYDDTFTVSSYTKTSTSTATIQYDSLYNVKIVDDVLYLYINKFQTYLVRLSGFEDKDKLIIQILLRYSKKNKK